MTSPAPTRRHMQSVDRPLCELASSVELIDEMMQTIYGHVDCEPCLRRAIVESEERTRVLRAMLAKAEDVA